MPPRIPKACRERLCPNITTHPHGYCDKHADKAKAFAGRKDSGRGGRPWRRLREAIKARANGLCEQCSAAGIVKTGSVCDHIIPRAEGGSDSPSNLQWLCPPCHDAKTQQEAVRGRQRGAAGGGAGQISGN